MNSEIENIFFEAIKIINKKSNTYQNQNSTVKQADYYPHGCITLYDLMNTKILRIKSILDTIESDEKYIPDFESLEDSCIDLINYTVFFIAYTRKLINGQDINKNIFNKEIK